MKTVLYFSPHQDDELLNFGADICREISLGSRVRVVLCTDGSASGVKKMLNNGGACQFHSGSHRFELSDAEFSAARDREFLLSCRRMGVKEEDIVISPLRARDGALSVERAEEIMLRELGFAGGGDVAVKTLCRIEGQNPDHAAVAVASKNLFMQKKFPELSGLYETLYFIGRELPETGMRYIFPDGAEKTKLFNAAQAYKIWEPDNGFYAVGLHSVADEFISFAKRPFSAIVTD